MEKLAEEKHLEKEFALYSAVERLAPGVIASERKIYKGVSANVDFYSGFVYNMLGLPVELFTPIFAVARIARMERTPSGGACRQGQDNPPGIYGGASEERLQRNR